jgi:alkylhydroperoxidase family enzyme
VQFAEQMTADVSTLTADQRAAALGEFGSSALPFVQTVWVCDTGTRARSAFDALFGDSRLDDPMSVGPAAAGVSAWSAQEQFLREVAKLTTLDPVTNELVRLRGARAHGCRLCQSLRRRTAVQVAGGAELFDASDEYERGELTVGHRAALDLVDAFVWQPVAWPEGLADRLRAAFSPGEATELILNLMRNSANKIAVALAADAPHVSEGVEYYDVDPASGELLYGLSPA